MSDNVPRLTGGILFGLILEARKARKRLRSTKLNGVETDKSDGLNEDDMMVSFIEIVTGESFFKPEGVSFKKNVSDYKKCVVSATSYLTFDDQTSIESFETSVKQNKKDTLERMSAFISDKFSEQKMKWFVSAIIETICDDETVDNSERFKVSTNNTVSKSELLSITTVEIEPFLLDVMRYIFVNKIDNKLGKTTFEEWYSQNGAKTQWKFINEELGKSLPSLGITRYNPDVEELEEQTDGIVEQEHVEESDTENEEEYNFNTEGKESVKQTLQQNADRIYNIGQANNVNNIVNYVPARNTLSPNNYYNLFIIYGEQYEGDSFTIENGRIFEYTNTAIGQKFSQFTLEDIDEITSLPVLFLPEYSDSNQEIKTGFFGKLVDIDKRARVTKFDFHKECEINLSSVVLHQADLRLEKLELTRTHWAIKHANLESILGEIKQ